MFKEANVIFFLNICVKILTFMMMTNFIKVHVLFFFRLGMTKLYLNEIICFLLKLEGVCELIEMLKLDLENTFNVATFQS